MNIVNPLLPTKQHINNDELRHAVMDDLGIPREFPTWWQVFPSGFFGKKWADYSAEVFGMVVDDAPTDPFMPWVRLTAGDAQIIVQVWRWRVYYRDCPAFLEQRWHPVDGLSVQLLGLVNCRTKTDPHKVLDGMEIIHHIASKSGRPGRRATGYTDDEVREIAYKMQRRRKKHGTSWGKLGAVEGIDGQTAQRWCEWYPLEE